VARTIHYSGPRAQGRFVEINCAALPPQLLESELFGHQKGAFTDAKESKRGLIEIADGGTLFLDEIGDIPPDLQAKLLNFVESRRFRRVGGTEELEVSVRLITATNRNLEQLVKEGKFRADLFYRISVAVHTLPSLREIREDIPLLADHFRELFNKEFGRSITALSPDALKLLTAWHWPGNVRELRNVMERAMIFAEGSVLDAAHVPTLGTMAGGAPPADGDAFAIPRNLTLADVERAYIEATLAACDDRVQQAAEILGISRKNLWEKRKRYGLLE
jgi:two-component system response regulator AtoC